MSKLKAKPYAGKIKDGLWLGVPNSIYHASDHLSSSMIRVLMRSPLEYKRTIDGIIKRESTDAMDYGTAAHAAILEGRMDAFYIRPDTYADGKPWNGNASFCKEWADAHSDKPVVSAKQVQELSAASEYVHSHPQAKRILCGGNYEVSVFSKGEKARCDFLKIDGDSAIVADLKTCKDASTFEFSKEIVNRGYHIQFAWYRRVLSAVGIKHFRFYFIALQKGQMPLVNVLEMHPMAMDAADKKIADALDVLQKCIANNYWPEWSDFDGTHEIKTVDIPEWEYSASGPVELEMGGQSIEV